MTQKLKNIKGHFNEDFFAYKTAHNLKVDALFNTMWQTFINYNNLFSEEETEVIKKAANETNNTPKDLIRLLTLRGLKNLSKVRNVNKEHVYTQQADQRMNTVLQAMMKNNDQAKNWFDKIYITPYSIKNYVATHQNEVGIRVISQNVLKRSVGAFKEVLEQHHKKHHLDEHHNRKAYNYFRTRPKDQNNGSV